MNPFLENAFFSCHCKAVMLSQSEFRLLAWNTSNHLYYDRMFYF